MPESESALVEYVSEGSIPADECRGQGKERLLGTQDAEAMLREMDRGFAPKSPPETHQWKNRIPKPHLPQSETLPPSHFDTKMRTPLERTSSRRSH
jgi:hypothetical protein